MIESTDISRATQLAAAMLVLLIYSNAWARDKTDVVTLSNGDHVTGEIKELDHGILRVSTASMGEVRIEWEDVTSIQSDYQFQFERTDGQRIVATIQSIDDQYNITLENNNRTISFAHGNIIRISPIENSFWNRIKGSFNFGYSFTKASDIAQLNFGVRASHRTAIREFSIDSNIVTTSDQLDQTTQRSDLQTSMTRFRSDRWFNTYLLGFESNDELGLKLRSSLGAGLGRYLVQTNLSEFSLLGGLVATAETLVGDASPQQNLEGLLGAEFSRYIFDDPTVDLSFRLSVFPSITSAGRYRAQFDANIRRELISDLYWDLNYYQTYDSDPPSGETESTSDYGIVTSLGWSF